MSLSYTQIQPFVRQVLGCQCPAEVFEKIEVSDTSLCGLDFQRILIGERLMVCLLSCPLGEHGKDNFPALVEALRVERDNNGWNRVRIVLMESEGDSCDGELTTLFERVAAGDGKLHLHRVDRAQADSISVNRP